MSGFRRCLGYLCQIDPRKSAGLTLPRVSRSGRAVRNVQYCPRDSHSSQLNRLRAEFLSQHWHSHWHQSWLSALLSVRVDLALIFSLRAGVLTMMSRELPEAHRGHFYALWPHWQLQVIRWTRISFDSLDPEARWHWRDLNSDLRRRHRHPPHVPQQYPDQVLACIQIDWLGPLVGRNLEYTNFAYLVTNQRLRFPTKYCHWSLTYERETFGFLTLCK